MYNDLNSNTCITPAVVDEVQKESVCQESIMYLVIGTSLAVFGTIIGISGVTFGIITATWSKRLETKFKKI